jgi:putative flippase GtrA
VVAEMLRYGLVGLVNTGIGYGVIAVAMQVIGLHYLVANVLGYGAGVTASFFLNKFFTFRSRGAITLAEPLLFLAVIGGSYLLQFGALAFLVEVAHVERLLAQALAMALYAAAGYAGNRRLTFRRRPPPAPGDR